MIAEYGGLSAVMPVYATVFLIITMSSIGLPALNGFIGEFTILVGRLRAQPGGGRVLAALGIVLGAAYMLWLYQRVFFGPLDQPGEPAACRTSTAASSLYLVPLVVLCFWIGLYPQARSSDVLEKPVELRGRETVDPARTPQAGGRRRLARRRRHAAAAGE